MSTTLPKRKTPRNIGAIINMVLVDGRFVRIHRAKRFLRSSLFRAEWDYEVFNKGNWRQDINDHIEAWDATFKSSKNIKS